MPSVLMICTSDEVGEILACKNLNGVLFGITHNLDRATFLKRFSAYAASHLSHCLHELAGKRLVGHCASTQPCHGDTLIDMFNTKFSSKDSAEAAGVVGKVSPTRSASHCESVSLRVLLSFTGARRHGSIMWQLAELSKQLTL